MPPEKASDEPTSELDEGNALHVVAELRALADEGRVVVIATHDPAVARACDREYVLDEGRITSERHRVAGAARP